jgi:hypothetical protein
VTTLTDLRVKLERDYLEPVNERTPQTPLSANVTDVATSLPLTGGILSIDEESAIGPGSVLEIDEELVFVDSYNQNTSTATVRRGYDGTTKAAHTTESFVRIPTRWPRHSQIDALRESLEALFPSLYSVATETGTTDSMRYVPLPLATCEVLRVQWQNGSRWTDCQAELFATYPLDDSYAAVQLENGVPPNVLCNLRYGIRPVLPDDSATDIANYAEKWTRLIVVDAAVRLLSGVDIDAVTQEYLTEQIRLERFPVRSGSSITQSLIRYREYLLEQAITDLLSNEALPVEMASVEYYG